MKWILILVLFISCNEADEKTTTTDVSTSTDTTNPASPSSPAPNDPGTPVSNCFLRVTGRDSLRLSYTTNANSITGKMMYDNYQKDGSWGTVKGTINGDTLKTWYDFESEGMRSVRRIIFKMENERLLPATGEFIVRGDSSLYADESRLEFGKEGALQKVDCGVLRFTF